MKLQIVFLAIFLTATVVAQTPTNAPLQLESSVDLPGISGDMDHLAIDPAGARLFAAAEDNGTLRVIDLKTGRLVRTVKGFETPHGIVFLPDRKELFITDGSKSVKVLDSDSFAVKREVPTTPGADSVVVDTRSSLMYAVSGGKDVKMTTSKISTIDLKASKLKTEIPINAAHVEAMAIESTGPRLFVNVTDKNYLAVIDRAAGKMEALWPIKEAQQNAPLAFDEAHRRLFVVCRQPGTLVVLDSSTGKSVASFPTGARADEVVFDAAHHRIYVAAGEGKIYPYQQVDADHYKPLTPVPSAAGAKTALLAPDATHLYVAVSPGEGKTGAKILAFRVN